MNLRFRCTIPKSVIVENRVTFGNGKVNKAIVFWLYRRMPVPVIDLERGKVVQGVVHIRFIEASTMRGYDHSSAASTRWLTVCSR